MFRIAAKLQTFCEILLTYLSSVVTLFLTIMIVVDVTGRYFLNKPLPSALMSTVSARMRTFPGNR